MAAPNVSRSLEGGADGVSSTPNPQSSARAAAEIIAITTRDDFLLELGEALSGQASIRPVDSAATGLEHLNDARRVQLLVVDAREVTDVRAEIDHVHAHAPHILALVFSDAEAEKQVAAALKGSNVFAVLPLPVDKRKTAAVFDGAIAEAAIRRSTARAGSDARRADTRFDQGSNISVGPAHVGGLGSPFRDSGFGGNKKLILIAGGAGALLLIAGAAWFFARESTPPAAAARKPSVSITAVPANPSQDAVPEPAPVVETPLVKGTVDELLEKARLAMRERRYTEPAGDNALLYYRSAAAADTSNGEAQDGLTRVAAVLKSRLEEASSAGRYDEAATALAHLKAATPNDPKVTAIEVRLTTAQVTRALADGNLDRAAALVRAAQQSGAVAADQTNKWRADIGRRQDEAKQKRFVDLAQERIRDGRLLDPPNDSAKYYVDQMRELGPSGAAAQQRVMRDLVAAYMKKAREAAVANRASEVDRWLGEARAAGVSANDITGFQRELATARQRAVSAESERLAGLIRERLRDGKLTEPAQDSAAYFLTALQAADASNGAVAAASRELAAKLLDRAGAAARDAKTAQVDADLTQARRWGADAKDIQAVQQIAAAPKASTSANRNAAAGSLQGKLKRTRYSAPEYPDRALAQRATGSVTVEFVVDVNGEPHDVRVIAAEPVGVFDRAAISAVKRWRYEPVIVDNVPIEVPARTVIRFALPTQ